MIRILLLLGVGLMLSGVTSVRGDPTPAGSPGPGKSGAKLEFRVRGVVCAMCVQSIRKRVETLPEVASVEIDLKQGRVLILARDGKLLDAAAMTREIEKAGYELSEDSEIVRAEKKKGRID